MALHYHTSRKSGSFSWLFMRVSGLVLVILVILHYFLMHVNPSRGHTYAGVYEALTSPVWGPYFKGLDLTMLTLGLWHGLTGTWGIVRDYNLAAGWRLAILGLLIVGGVWFGTIGFATIMSF